MNLWPPGWVGPLLRPTPSLKDWWLLNPAMLGSISHSGKSQACTWSSGLATHPLDQPWFQAILQVVSKMPRLYAGEADCSPLNLRWWQGAWPWRTSHHTVATFNHWSKDFNGISGTPGAVQSWWNRRSRKQAVQSQPISKSGGPKEMGALQTLFAKQMEMRSPMDPFLVWRNWASRQACLAVGVGRWLMVKIPIMYATSGTYSTWIAQVLAFTCLKMGTY